MKKLAGLLVFSALAVGCDDEPQFDCSEMDMAGVMFCDDFNDGEAPLWHVESGEYSVEDGRYIGEGPDELDGSVCAASLMSASLREGSSAQDVAMHAELRSLERVDKALVLRARDSSNRIEINFRADPLNDLMVQELVDCELVYHTEEGEIPLPHAMEDDLDIEVQLRGDRLVVFRDGEQVMDREFDFANDAAGQVGVAVIDRSLTSFDSVWVEVL